MSIVLNAFPLKVPELELEVLQIQYDKETLDDLRDRYRATHAFRRQGDNILIFSGDGTFPASGTPQTIALKDNIGIFCSLVKDGLTRHLAGLGRNPSGFNPIELVSAKPEDGAKVQALLEATDGVEVHTVAEDGRMIVTIEAESEQATVKTYELINLMPGVLAVSMVYHQIESNPDEEA